MYTGSNLSISTACCCVVIWQRCALLARGKPYHCKDLHTAFCVTYPELGEKNPCSWLREATPLPPKVTPTPTLCWPIILSQHLHNRHGYSSLFVVYLSFFCKSNLPTSQTCRHTYAYKQKGKQHFSNHGQYDKFMSIEDATCSLRLLTCWR